MKRELAKDVLQSFVSDCASNLLIIEAPEMVYLAVFLDD